MKIYCYFFTLLLGIGCIRAQTEFAVNHQNFEKNGITAAQADSIFEKVKKVTNQTQIAIAIIKNGTPLFYGIKRENDSIVSVENYENVFEIGSISKVFTSTLMAGLLLDKKINSLDNYVDTYLGFTFKDDQKLSFKDLANHTSGLPRMPTNFGTNFMNRNNPFADYDEVKLKAYLTDTMALTKDRPVAYSNLGVGLLGYTLSKIEDTTYAELLQQRITSKYEMPNTTAVRSEVAVLLIKGRNGGTIVPNWDLSVLEGAGGILSNVQDLSKFAIAQFDPANKELALTRVKTVSAGEKANVGLGWFILKTDFGDSIFFHNGGTGGYTSSMMLDMETKNGVIILSNISALSSKMGAIDNLSKSLMRTLQN